ncbi:hypothetical protein SAMN02745883_00888 [Caminicella sporogenes DSM 14501]|uniref:Uncharacterized protein n=1 Tax=Caminicella sporogenes DSM 14501 TaxID=1121266 RepID=A0A1M6NHS9_9FIRM|nr:hypothetical protein [Caminicella sporogenes]RKD22199.1 hypothetical protein BET04_06150 [Caminicella sporogenes]SHJ95202.1 hypothetical protein SAMN02745883_00888 [Caminicella sporogenes DSM 14501]
MKEEKNKNISKLKIIPMLFLYINIYIIMAYILKFFPIDKFLIHSHIVIITVIVSMEISSFLSIRNKNPYYKIKTKLSFIIATTINVFLFILMIKFFVLI